MAAAFNINGFLEGYISNRPDIILKITARSMKLIYAAKIISSTVGDPSIALKQATEIILFSALAIR